jgi:hypothetical protein
MRRLLTLLLPIAALAPSCATQVYHPTKSEIEMQADIQLCSDEANRKFWMDSIAALYNAYDCLEAKGYTRAQSSAGERVEKAVAAGAKTKGAPVEACRVPCRRNRS